ncbi:hypothetical protein [Methanobrevibacter sp.]|uniref:hypothetical protein n=1 Tax=Methanobrevibacter sp. TaxID=66852 RepID=UPI0025E5B9C1|nr:hypothetical protein [Methanobrevibacter sp.]MBQ2665865.1 hypothetical protein [Methanobrevibacter sp.]
MEKLKKNVIILIMSLLILAGIGLYLNSMTETVEFEEFSVEVPLGSSFVTMTPEDRVIKEMYRCTSEDLTITSFDKKYIEDKYFDNTGQHIDFFKGLLENQSTDNDEISNISENITRIVQTSHIDGYEDTDVACIYHDDDHVIFIEGGDVEFITKISESIRIR